MEKVLMVNSFIRWTSENGLVVAICAVVLGTITLFLVIDSRNAEFQAAVVRQIEEDVARESRIACERWGMEAATAAHIACVADLATIRANHDNRRRTDDFGF
jgi:hypothetical protein